MALTSVELIHLHKQLKLNLAHDVCLNTAAKFKTQFQLRLSFSLAQKCQRNDLMKLKCSQLKYVV